MSGLFLKLLNMSISASVLIVVVGHFGWALNVAVVTKQKTNLKCSSRVDWSYENQ